MLTLRAPYANMGLSLYVENLCCIYAVSQAEFNTFGLKYRSITKIFTTMTNKSETDRESQRMLNILNGLVDSAHGARNKARAIRERITGQVDPSSGDQSEKAQPAVGYVDSTHKGMKELSIHLDQIHEDLNQIAEIF